MATFFDKITTLISARVRSLGRQNRAAPEWEMVIVAANSAEAEIFVHYLGSAEIPAATQVASDGTHVTVPRSFLEQAKAHLQQGGFIDPLLETQKND
jgi:hypothetical protein